jgi:hypothetical protein
MHEKVICGVQYSKESNRKRGGMRRADNTARIHIPSKSVTHYKSIAHYYSLSGCISGARFNA